MLFIKKMTQAGIKFLFSSNSLAESVGQNLQGFQNLEGF